MRNIFDAANKKEIALPAQNASANTASIDLGSAGDAVIEEIEVELVLPATPDLADGQTITVTLEDSADDSSFAAITGLSTVVATGAGGVGAAAASRKIKLPSTVRRYIRASFAASATAGDNTAVTGYFRVLT